MFIVVNGFHQVVVAVEVQGVVMVAGVEGRVRNH